MNLANNRRVLYIHDGPRWKDFAGNFHGTNDDLKLVERYKYLGEKVDFMMRVFDLTPELFSRTIHLNVYGVKIISIPPFNRPHLLFNYFKASKIIKSEIQKYDILVIRLPSAIGSLALRLAKTEKIPYIVEVVALFYPFAKGVFIQTDEGINLLKKKYKLTNFIKLSNPVINNINCIPIQRRDKIIINVGYLGGNKNQAALIRYFSEIENYDWKLYLIGDGPDREKLKSLIDTLQLNERVFLLGARTDVNKLLNNAQIFAFTSLTEGFPNALAEALAAGCACISFDCITGPRELIKNNYNGYLVDINDNEGYKTKLAELMNSFELREKFSKSSLEKIKQFNIDTITKQFINILFPQND